LSASLHVGVPHDREADEARHDHGDSAEPGQLLDRHQEAREGRMGTTSLSPVLDNVANEKEQQLHPGPILLRGSRLR